MVRRIELSWISQTSYLYTITYCMQSVHKLLKMMNFPHIWRTKISLSVYPLSHTRPCALITNSCISCCCCFHVFQLRVEDSKQQRKKKDKNHSFRLKRKCRPSYLDFIIISLKIFCLTSNIPWIFCGDRTHTHSVRRCLRRRDTQNRIHQQYDK